MKAQTEIEAGICNFVTVVTANTEDGQNVTLDFETTCSTMNCKPTLRPEVQ